MDECFKLQNSNLMDLVLDKHDSTDHSGTAAIDLVEGWFSENNFSNHPFLINSLGF